MLMMLKTRSRRLIYLEFKGINHNKSNISNPASFETNPWRKRNGLEGQERVWLEGKPNDQVGTNCTPESGFKLSKENK